MNFTIKLFLINLLLIVDGYKILIYNPRFENFHVSFRGKFADILANAGHDIVVFQPIFDFNSNFTGSFHPKIRYIFMENKNHEENNVVHDKSFFWQKDTLPKFIKLTNAMFETHKNHCLAVIKNAEILEKLKKEKFDIGFGEIFDSCSFGVFDLIGLKKYIALHPGGMNPMIQDFLGIPKTFSFAPSSFSTFSDQMNFFQRIGNFFSIQMEAYGVGKIFTNGPESAMQQIVPGFDIKEKIRNSAFFFVNSDENVDFTMPITPKLIFTGGIQESTSETLEKPFLDIFDTAKKGVIYFSPGKIVESQSMPENLKKAFLEAFGEFPEINFIWNFGNGAEKVGKTPKNVFVFETAPENAILENSKTLAFINHAEMDAVNSGIMKGIPMIAIPVFADQFHNAKILERQNVGETVSKNEITKENLINKIKKIVENESYKKNAEKLAKIINAKVIKAEERIVKFTEFAAKFGDSETLQTEGRKLGWIQLYSLDVVLFVVIVLVTIILGFFKLIKKATKKVQQIIQKPSTTKKNN